MQTHSTVTEVLRPLPLMPYCRTTTMVLLMCPAAAVLTNMLLCNVTLYNGCCRTMLLPMCPAVGAAPHKHVAVCCDYH
jgi:hypothetical protein